MCGVVVASGDGVCVVWWLLVVMVCVCGVVVASGADGVCVVWWLLVVMLQSTYILACPIPTQDPGGQHIGFLLNSLRVTVALTSENTAKNLPKEENKDIVHFRGLGAHTHTCTGSSRRSAKSLPPPHSPSFTTMYDQ